MKNIDILLINPPFHLRNNGGSFLPLGLGYIISSINKSGYSWSVIDCTSLTKSFDKQNLVRFTSLISKELIKYKPKVIGIGPCITTQLRALSIITECCHTIFPNTPIFAGGPLASIKGQEWFFFDFLKINYIIKGDGEIAVVDAIFNIVEKNSIEESALVSKKGYSHYNELKDISSLDFPFRGEEMGVFSKRRGGDNSEFITAAMITSRGCPYSCNYCVSGNLSSQVRKRSNESIIAEMKFLAEKYNINDVVFYDDCFFVNKQNPNYEITQFCDTLMYNKVNMWWQIEMRPDMFLAINNKSILKLNEVGCRQINLGIEKTSDAGLAFLGKSINLQGLKEKINDFKMLSEIKIAATFILGGENESKEDVLKIIENSVSLGLDYIHYNPLFIYPGTPLYNKKFNSPNQWVDVILQDELPWGEIVYDSENLSAIELIQLTQSAYNETEDRFNISKEEN